MRGGLFPGPPRGGAEAQAHTPAAGAMPLPASGKKVAAVFMIYLPNAVFLKAANGGALAVSANHSHRPELKARSWSHIPRRCSEGLHPWKKQPPCSQWYHHSSAQMTPPTAHLRRIAPPPVTAEEPAQLTLATAPGKRWTSAAMRIHSSPP